MPNHFAKIGGSLIEIHRWPARRADRRTLVLLHEGLGCSAGWHGFPEKVNEATGLAVVAPSRIGFGRSARRPEPFGTDYLRIEGEDRLPALIDALNIDAPILIGHSDGATIALIYAAAGNATAGLALMAPHVFVEDLTLDGIAEAGEAFRDGRLRSALARLHDDPDAVFGDWYRIWTSPAFRSWNIVDSLRSIRAPTVLLQGDADQYGTFEQLFAIRRAVAGPCRIISLPKVGHAPHRDAPDAVLAAIEELIDHPRQETESP